MVPLSNGLKSLIYLNINKKEPLINQEFTKLCALRPLVSYVPRILRALCFTCSRAVRASCHACSRASCASCHMCVVPYVLSCLACFVPYVLSCPTCLVSYVLERIHLLLMLLNLKKLVKLKCNTIDMGKILPETTNVQQSKLLGTN